VRFEVTGPASIVGDNPFNLSDSGGVGAVWLKAAASGSGPVTVTATHSALGTKTVSVRVSALRET
jgi:beta-galactosidase